MSFRRRSYAEVLSSLLTAVVGGVSGERHPFPPPGSDRPPYLHALTQPPVGDIVSVYGMRNGASYEFAKNKDYRLAENRQSLQWEEGGALPDEGTPFVVNYVPQGARPPANDLEIGSVTRTLVESVGVEIAALYAQLEEVYRAAYIDTATGLSLDNVVALLDLERIRAGRFGGEVEFTRSAGSLGIIAIPAGTRIMTADGNLEYETTTAVTLLDGQTAIRVFARDVETNTSAAGAGTLVVVEKPIAGIASVTNPGPTSLIGRDESDEELRTRAKSFLHGSERATVGALREAIAQQGIAAEVEELKDEQGRQTGRVVVTPFARDLTPEMRHRLNAAIEDARPVGVSVTLSPELIPPSELSLRLLVETDESLGEETLRAAHEQIRRLVGDYVGRLAAAEAVSTNRIIALVLGVPGVKDVRLLDPAPELTGAPKVLGNVEIIDPNLPTRVRLVIVHPKAASVPAKSSIESQLTSTLSYLNAISASRPPAEDVRLRLEFGRLLLVVPLPAVEATGKSLREFDEKAAGGAPPALPGPREVLPYVVHFYVIKEGALGRELSDAGDLYALTPLERCALAGVEIVEGSDGG